MTRAGLDGRGLGRVHGRPCVSVVARLVVVLAEVRASHVYCPSGSADAILALINAGASVSAYDKDGLTGELKTTYCISIRTR